MRKKTSDGVRYIETTMGIVRELQGWHDSFPIYDDTAVLVHEDGSVNAAYDGSMICEEGFLSSEHEDDWRNHFGFESFGWYIAKVGCIY